MGKRLQVILDDAELRDIQRIAKQKRMSVAEWVRQDIAEKMPTRSRSCLPARLADSFQRPDRADQLNLARKLTSRSCR